MIIFSDNHRQNMTGAFEVSCYDINGRFYTKDALSVRTNLGKHLKFVWLCVFSIKTGTRRIMRLDELSLVVRCSRRISKDSSSTSCARLYCWRAIARQHTILYNRAKAAKSVGCKIGDMRSRLRFLYPGIPGCL